MNGRKRALVLGATGITGRRIAELLGEREEWSVLGVASRPRPAPEPWEVRGNRLLAVDLTDGRAVQEALSGETGITHVFYAARYGYTTTQAEAHAINLRMLVDVMDAVEPANPGLAHVHLVHGTKYYGSHLGGPFRTPAREDDPRTPFDEFYYLQQDFIAERRRGKAWSWSVSRPHGICDDAPGIARNMSILIPVYAALCKAEGMPLFFPGTQGNFDAVYQVTESAHLARAVVWMATEPRCADQAFNVTNGDFVRWRNEWDGFADYFGMKPGPVRWLPLQAAMTDKGHVWDRVVAAHGLVPTPYADIVSWHYAEHLFKPDWDMMSATTKLRDFGFHGFVDTPKMFYRHFERFRELRLVP